MPAKCWRDVVEGLNGPSTISLVASVSNSGKGFAIDFNEKEIEDLANALDFVESEGLGSETTTVFAGLLQSLLPSEKNK